MKLKGSFKGFSSAKNSPLLGGEASLAKLRESFKKPRQAKEEKKEVKKDDSVWQGKRLFATPGQRREWLRRHIGDIWKATKGRVTSAKIPKYDEELTKPKSRWGDLIEKPKHEPEMIRKEMQKAYWRAKTDKERWVIKRNMAVFDKMYGLEKK